MMELRSVIKSFGRVRAVDDLLLHGQGSSAISR
jgi:hypothetical protein